MNVLITGGSGKIGSKLAIDIAKRGWVPILADINEDSLKCVSKSLEDKIHYCILSDITSQKGITNCISESLSKCGQIDAAVHASYPKSIGWPNKFEELNEKFLKEDLYNQLGSAILFSKEITKYFLSRRKGHLIHISSIQGISAPKFNHYLDTDMTSPIEYAAIKSGIISITKWLAKYYKGKGMRINCISPGGIKDKQPDSFIKNYKNDCNNIGMLSSSHITSTILFLLSKDSSAINGQNLIIDDGWSL
tara:strand:+ start:1307 stop:2053 length:747 start_codon:yes stop_codon:yes gene_type:complete